MAASATLAAATASSSAATSSVAGTAAVALPARRIDTNVTLFQWPARRLPHDDPAALAQLLQKHGITQAWAGSFEGLLQRDLRAVNARLHEACQASNGRLVAFGSVNPTLPDWEEDLRRCHEIHRMPGIRLHPNYHGYNLTDARFKRLLSLAVERRLLVQLVCLIEDTRTQNPLLSVADVDVTPLPETLAAVPGARVQLLNGGKIVDGAALERLMRSPGLFLDTARVESVGGVGRLIRRLPANRVAFGSHAPFFIYESAVIKLFEAQLTVEEMRSLVDDTPRALLQS
jgi:uncharacterized protein